ncbi:MAG: hypothetical protein ABR577_09510 [Pyrinomonadaceae bacterium]
MSSKLTIIFYIVLCLEVGIVLTFLPWVHPFGLGDWGDNYFLLYAVQKTGLHGLQHAIASGWARGAVTGVGLLNLAIAFWEMAHFRQTARALQADIAVPPGRRRVAFTSTAGDAATETPIADPLSDYRRRDDRTDNRSL